MNNEELLLAAEQEREAQAEHEARVLVCQGTACHSSHSEQIAEAIAAELKKRGLEKRCSVVGVGCRGLCAAGPMVSVEPSHTLYHKVTVEDAPAIAESLPNGRVESLQLSTNTPFFTRQTKIVLENAGEISTERIEDYYAHNGYQALLRAITEMTPAEVIDEITKSGLRGRGGAGYPTGLKWGTVAKAVGSPKYVICNGDEGDPGAFMDRSVMEADPHRVLEGMAIAAYAVGASQGYLYVRAEYPLAVKRLNTAIRQAQKAGLLGENIAGTSFSFTVSVRLGAGAFVCGEETALIASIEGKRGTPRPRPPYPAQSGLWGKPTLINNVETYANVAPIIQRGSAWFASIGTAKSKGTKVFALAGKVNNIGLIEVPMGITLREVISIYAKGMRDGRAFKLAQTGGSSGSIIPAVLQDTPMDFDSYAKAGVSLGSGALLICNEDTCVVDLAKVLMNFFKSESCGRCGPCRIGTGRAWQILDGISQGVGKLSDLNDLETLANGLNQFSNCGLGQTAAVPIRDMLRYFRAEVEAHIKLKVCPGGACAMSGKVRGA